MEDDGSEERTRVFEAGASRAHKKACVRAVLDQSDERME
jgi:hypothetical protein